MKGDVKNKLLLTWLPNRIFLAASPVVPGAAERSGSALPREKSLCLLDTLG